MKFWPAPQIFSFFSSDLAIDLGTANTVIYVKDKGIILNQPSVVAVKKSTNEVLAAGDKAKEMLGKTPESIVASRPLRDGVIANFEMAENMLRYFIRAVHNNRRVLVGPRMIISVPSGITQVERRAVEDSAKQAGAREVYTIMEPMAAAIGAGMPVQEPSGNMIVDIGGGTTEVAIISLKDVVYCKSIRIGGDAMDRAIVHHIKRKYNLLIGEKTAERIKIEIGTAVLSDESHKIEVKGRNLVSGVPKTIELTDAEVFESLNEPISSIIEALRTGLENAPPEFSSDLVDHGIILAGGGSMLKNLDVLISKETGLPVRVAQDPLLSVVRGAGKVIDELAHFNEAVMK